MRRVARECGTKIVCINNNEQQLEKAKRRNIETGLDDLAEYIKCDFMDMSAIEANSFDAGYAIESTCHAPDKERAFAEIYRVLKPGALLWGQEMCMTEKFDPDDSLHRTIKEELKLGIALKEIATFSEVDHALESAGYEVIEAADRDDREGQGMPWYLPMESQSGTLRNAFRRTPLGRKAIFASLRLAEAVPALSEWFRGCCPIHGQNGKRLCRGRQDGHIHTALLFPCPQARVSCKTVIQRSNPKLPPFFCSCPLSC